MVDFIIRQSHSSTLITLYFMGGAYESTLDVNGAQLSAKKYYTIAGMTVAMNDGDGMKYLFTDHLGSVVAITDSSGTLISQQRYLPFGQVRTGVGSITQTDFGYTGQRNNSYIKLDDYKFRWYSDQLGRFISPDDIIPDLSTPQTLNRYAYSGNSPIVHNDPTGHCTPCYVVGGAALMLYGIASIYVIAQVEAAKPVGNNASNLWELMKLGVQHADHANITGEGLQSLEDDPSVQAAEGRIVADIKQMPNYGKQAFSIQGDFTDSKYPYFTANGPGRNFISGALTGNPAFWMVHSAKLEATNTKVSANGTISTTWKVEDQFDYLPDWANHERPHYWEYNIIATLTYPIYYGSLNAKRQVPTTAEWNQTRPPMNSCRRCE